MAVLSFPRPADPIADVRRRLDHRQTLTCACCGQRYRRGEWICCAPPGGMATGAWFATWHDVCASASAPTGPGTRKCPRHCRCPRRKPENNLPSVASVIERARHPSAARTSSLPMEDPEP